MRATILSDLVLRALDREAPTPMGRQIYQIVREAILARDLPAGLRLPSSRDLAQELRVSRNTVLFAYEQLRAEGYVEGQTGAGTFVADTTPDPVFEAEGRRTRSTQTAAPEALLGRRGRMLVEHAGAADRQWGAFVPGVPELTLFPNKVWMRLHNKHWRRPRPELLTYARGGGHAPLREALAEYLRVARSVNCDASQLLVTSGIHLSVDLIARMLTDPGDVVWIEDPGYWGTRSVLRSLGLELVPITVDREGLNPSPKHLKRPPRLIFVTPSHQYPLGSVMSLARRRLLLEYAQAHGAWIIEDDYDSEFRYASRPLASLQGMDSGHRVLYVGTLSKTMYPGLRMGFIVVPEALADVFARGLSELYREGNGLQQAVVADFMAEGHFASYVRRMRMLYGERLALLMQAVSRRFGDAIEIPGGDAGLHLAVALPEGCDDRALAARARERGVVVRPLSLYYANPRRARPGLMLGYACVPNHEIAPAFDRLAPCIEEVLRTAGPAGRRRVA